MLRLSGCDGYKASIEEPLGGLDAAYVDLRKYISRFGPTSVLSLTIFDVSAASHIGIYYLGRARRKLWKMCVSVASYCSTSGMKGR